MVEQLAAAAANRIAAVAAAEIALATELAVVVAPVETALATAPDKEGTSSELAPSVFLISALA
jgi:hypothetical protein